jgi:GNAT superfamily N-acetyltransferase
MSEIKITPYGPQWEEAHQAFARKYYNNRRRRVLPHYIYWKFRGERGKELPSFILAVVGDEVVGQLGVVPGEVKFKDKLFAVHWACDLMVSSDYRGKGIANMLYTDAVNRKIVFASDVSPSAAVSMARFGFRELPAPTKLFYPINLSTLTDKVFPRLSKLARYLPNPMLWLLKLQKGVSGGLKAIEIDEAQIDYSWIAKNHISDRIYAVHDAAHYSWRLGAFEDFQQKGMFLQVKETCFAAIRISGKLGLIVDFYSKDNRTTKRVLRDIILMMKKKGVEEIKFLSTHPEIIQICKRLGFVPGRSHVDIIYCSKNEEFNRLVKEDTLFEYTLIDCDENI